MADGVLSFPFRLTSQGHAAVAPYGSDQEVEEAIAALTLTLAGERPMEPEFGISDPTWGGITLNSIQTGVADFGPDGITILDVEQEVLTEAQSAYVITWSREPVEQDNL